jgi:hypothetical protein
MSTRSAPTLCFSSQTNDLCYPPAPTLPRELHDEVHTPLAVPLHLLEAHAQPCGHDHDRQPIDGFTCGVGVDRRERPTMPCVDRFEKGSAFLPAVALSLTTGVFALAGVLPISLT